MTLPAWANEEFSSQLTSIRADGESRYVEFKEDFPQQGHSLCTEVAAFANSGGGTILLGVCNNGSVAGLDGSSEEKRDELLHRVQNLISTVQPSVDYQIAICYDDGCILGIVIAAKQSEPVYYYNHRAYVRDNRMSRPATPDEVKSLVWAHPSSEHKRKLEELQYQMMVDHQEDTKRLNAMQADTSAEAMRSFLGSVK